MNKQNKEMEELLDLIEAYTNKKIRIGLQGLIEQEKQAVAKEILNTLEEQGQGGGNWRRLIIQLKSKYGIDTKSN